MHKFESDLFSSLFSHVYVHHLDSNSLTPAFLHHVHYWYRYVDDVLCYGQDPSRSFTNFSPTSIVSTPPSLSLWKMEVLTSTSSIYTFPSEMGTMSSVYMGIPSALNPINLLISMPWPIAWPGIPVTLYNSRNEIAVIKHLASVNKVEVKIDRMTHKKVTRNCLPREPPSRKKLRWL